MSEFNSTLLGFYAVLVRIKKNTQYHDGGHLRSEYISFRVVFGTQSTVHFGLSLPGYYPITVSNLRISLYFLLRTAIHKVHNYVYIFKVLKRPRWDKINQGNNLPRD